MYAPCDTISIGLVVVVEVWVWEARKWVNQDMIRWRNLGLSAPTPRFQYVGDPTLAKLGKRS